MLPVRDQSGRSTSAWSLVAALLLVASSLLPVYLGLATAWYGAAAAAAGLWILFRAIAFLKADGRDAAARKLFLASIAYLPLELAALVADRLIHF
jgi:protoheme IX farnesyltransferase